METNIQAQEKALSDSAESLIEVSRIDPLYGDLYLSRARELLKERMSPSAYRGVRGMKTELANLPNRIRNAMMQGEWGAVKDLSGQLQSMKQYTEQNQVLIALARKVYEEDTIPIDPFSPGMQRIAGVQQKELPALRDRGVALLGKLMGLDGNRRDFYARRREDLQAREVALDVSAGQGHRPSAAGLRQEALEALESGNLDKLQELAGALGETETAGIATHTPSESGIEAPRENLDFVFPDDVLSRARRLGFAQVKVEARFREYARLTPYIWHPTFADLEGEQGLALRLSKLPMPDDTPQALRTRVEMFVLHPFVNSAGIRFLPPLVDEDVLVEDFEEPAADSEMPGCALLEALGVKKRNGLTRIQIEEALAERGCSIVKDELGLDPFAFRLICIPPDLHLRVGLNRGWGTQTIWTHFDGYMLSADGKVHALAGGDVRFGGVYDMVGISRNYDSDRIIVRFAVVQRRRMDRWKI